MSAVGLTRVEGLHGTNLIFSLRGGARKCLWTLHQLALVRRRATVSTAFEDFHLGSDRAESISGNEVVLPVIDGVMPQFKVYENH